MPSDAIKQLKADKKQWICGQAKQQRTDRQSPEPDEEQRPATPARWSLDAARFGQW
jgi:hypothetical protein